MEATKAKVSVNETGLWVPEPVVVPEGHGSLRGRDDRVTQIVPRHLGHAIEIKQLRQREEALKRAFEKIRIRAAHYDRGRGSALMASPFSDARSITAADLSEVLRVHFDVKLTAPELQALVNE